MASLNDKIIEYSGYIEQQCSDCTHFDEDGDDFGWCEKRDRACADIDMSIIKTCNYRDIYDTE